MVNIEQSQENFQKETAAMKQQQECIQKYEAHIDENSFKILQLNYKIIELEAKSRQNNIIIYGLQEDSYSETVDDASDFIYRNLDLDPNEMNIVKALRLGRVPRSYNTRIQGKPKRPLLVSFK